MRRRFCVAARLHGFGHAGRGLRRLLRDEHNAWLHPGATLAAALVWTAEAFNTAVERLCDRFHPGFDPAISAIKDLAAGAVLIAAIAAALIGALTLGPILLERM